MQLERRSGDPSAVAGASILASLSNLRQDLTRWKSPSQTASKPHKLLMVLFILFYLMAQKFRLMAWKEN
jgi:hypothetical protein